MNKVDKLTQVGPDEFPPPLLPPWSCAIRPDGGIGGGANAMPDALERSENIARTSRR